MTIVMMVITVMITTIIMIVIMIINKLISLCGFTYYNLDLKPNILINKMLLYNYLDMYLFLIRLFFRLFSREARKTFLVSNRNVDVRGLI